MDYSGKNRGIVLHTMKYGENGLVVYMYTENNGRMSYFMRNNKRGRVTIGKNRIVLQPFTPIDFIANSNSDGSVIRFSEAKHSFLTVNTVFDIRKSTIALFLSEFIYRVVKENFPNPLMFDFIYNSVNALDSLERGVSNFHVYFVSKLTKYMGFYPVENYEKDYYFDISLGRYTVFRPQHDNFFSQESSFFLYSFLLIDLDKIGDIAMDRFQRIELLNNLMKYYEYHNETRYKIVALKILSDIF